MTRYFFPAASLPLKSRTGLFWGWTICVRLLKAASFWRPKKSGAMRFWILKNPKNQTGGKSAWKRLVKSRLFLYCGFRLFFSLLFWSRFLFVLKQPCTPPSVCGHRQELKRKRGLTPCPFLVLESPSSPLCLAMEAGAADAAATR